MPFYGRIASHRRTAYEKQHSIALHPIVTRMTICQLSRQLFQRLHPIILFSAKEQMNRHSTVVGGWVDVGGGGAMADIGNAQGTERIDNDLLANC